MNKTESKPTTRLLRLPVSLHASHFDRGVHCVAIVDANGRVIVSSVAQDDAREVAAVLNSHAAQMRALEGARAALMCFWHHSPTKIEAEIARIDNALAKGGQ